ncbi:MAG: rRNA adenine dimethyltransferase family protein [bacterium]
MSPPSLSQVLLTDEYWRQRSAAVVPEASFGVEWASGKGALTELLTATWDYLLAMELDAEFCRVLRRKLSADEAGVLRTDVLSYPLPERSDTYPLVGNLPYHLTGPLLEKLAKNTSTMGSFTGLIQWEVAHRLDANPGDSEYRSISVLMNWAFDVRLLDRVPGSAFTPEPDVDSGLIQLKSKSPDRPFESMSTLIQRCFQQPRKTLLNNLADSSEQKDSWRLWMQQNNWNIKRRPSSLTVEEIKEVHDRWAQDEFS